MALGDPISGGMNVQATLFFNGINSGWTETYFLNVNGGTDPLTSAEQAMNRLTKARQGIMSNAYNCVALRTSLVTVRGDSNLAFPPLDWLGPGNDTSAFADPTLGWLIRVENDSFQVNDSRIYRGWPENLVPAQPRGLPGVFSVPKIEAWAATVKTVLTSANTYTSGVVKFCLRSFLRPDPITGYVKVPLWSVDSSGFLQIQVPASTIPSTWDFGKTLKLNVPRKKCLKGINGRARIISITPQLSGISIIRLDKRICCGSDLLAGVTGTAYLVDQAFYQVKWVVLDRQSTRKVGRPFFVPRGRQSAKCC